MSANTGTKGFTAEEKAAMRERAKELKAAANKAEAPAATIQFLGTDPATKSAIWAYLRPGWDGVDIVSLSATSRDAQAGSMR